MAGFATSFDEANDHLCTALNLFTTCGDVAAQAHTYLNLGQVTERQGHYSQALDQSRQALVLFERAECLAGQAYTLNAVGWQEALLGSLTTAHIRTGSLLGERVLTLESDGRGSLDGVIPTSRTSSPLPSGRLSRPCANR